MFLLISLFSALAFGQSKAKKKPRKNNQVKIARSKKNKNIISVIDEELKTLETRFPRAIKTDPDMMFRVSELYFEKAKRINEDENKAFLNADIKMKQKYDRNYWFKRSRVFFMKAQKYGLRVLKRTKNKEMISEVYLILAFNAKEFQNLDQSRRFFELAIKFSKKGSKVNHQAKVELGNYYYNERNFKKALTFYSDALRFKDYKWWTKDSTNMAWCYYQLNNYDMAIKVMDEVYFKSLKPNWLDVSEQAIKHITNFYASAKKVEESIQFFKKAKKDISESMINMARVLMIKEMLPTAETSLNLGEKYSKNIDQKKNIHLMRLKVFEKFGQVGKHFNISKRLFKIHKKNPVNEEQKKEFSFQMGNMAARLQKQVVDTSYVDEKGKRKSRAKIAANYFRMLSVVESDKATHYNFLEGETWYAVKSFASAIKVYYTAIVRCQKIKCDKTLQDKVINSALATLGQDQLGAKTKKKYLESTYVRILQLEPVSPRSQKIYIKLFNVYLAKSKTKQAEDVIKVYQKYYSKDYQVLEGMVARILDIYRKKNDIAKLMSWAERINRKEFIVSQKYENALYKSLATLRLAKIQKLINTGDKKNALKGYRQLYAYRLTPVESKKFASYNIMLLYFELGWSAKTLLWAKNSIKLQNNKELIKFADTYLALMNDLFLRREIENSADLSKVLLQRLCNEKFKYKNELFKNSAGLYFANDQNSKSFEFLNDFQKCEISSNVVEEIRFQYLDYFMAENDFNDALQEINKLKLNEKNLSKLLVPLSRIYNFYVADGSNKSIYIKDLMEQFAEILKKNKSPLPIDYLEVQASLKYPQLLDEVKNLEGIKLNFPENVFNELLQQKIVQLEKVTEFSLKIFKFGIGHFNLKTYKTLIDTYQKFISEVDNFIPPNKPPEYVKGFQQSMKSLTSPLTLKVKEFNRSARKLIRNKSLLSYENHHFINNGKLPVIPFYDFSKGNLIMDRRGD